MTKAKTILFMAALGLATVAMMGDMIIIPVADILYATYNNTSAVSYILSAPALITAIVSALAGVIIKKIGARRFLLLGFAIFAIAASITAFTQDLNVLLVSRTLQGVGMGAVGVCAIVLISDLFLDEKKRSSMIGIYNGIMAMVGAVLGQFSGIIASMGWEKVFWIYLITIPSVIFMYFFIPNTDATNATESEMEEASGGAAAMPWGIVIRVTLAFFVFNLLYCIVYYQVAVIMADKGIADTAFVGTLAALGTLGSFFACTFFGIYVARLKRFTITLGFVLLAALFLALYVTTSSMLIAIICTLMGATFGLGLSYYLTYATLVVPQEHIPLSTAAVTFGMGISSFLANYVPYWTMSAINTSSITAIIPYIVAILAVGAVLSVFFGRKEGEYFQEM